MIQAIVIIILSIGLFLSWNKMPKPIQGLGYMAYELSKDIFSSDSKPPEQVSTVLDSVLKKNDIDISFKE